MKSFKKVVALVLSLVMVLSCMTVSVSAANPSTKKTSITGATVTVAQSAYTGQPQTATSITVTLNGKTLKAGVDYKVITNAGGTNSGDYQVVIQGINDYEGTAIGTFTITGAANANKKTTVVATTNKTVSAKSVKKGKTISLKFKAKDKKNKSKKIESKVLKKGNKKTRKGIKVTYKKGKLKIKMPKGTKKGTYKIKVRLASYNKYKKSAWKTITIKVK